MTPNTLSDRRFVALRMRRDLVVRLPEPNSRGHYVIKDPLSLRYYHLRPDEYFVLSRLDGSISLQQLRDAYQQEFIPTRVSYGELESLLHRLHQLGLVLSETAEQGFVWEKRQHTERWQSRIEKLSSLLFIRFPGIDPEPLLKKFYPWIFRFLRFDLFIMACIFALGALAIVWMNWQQIGRETMSMQSLLATNIVSFMIVISLTKIAHEFGHAILCHHLGGECHQIGPMLLFLTPALYCDTSDSWMMRSRWHRVAVGAAGMGTELLLATVACFVWWMTQTGFAHAMSLRVMLVCSVSTCLINANPLLRYDGYYILADCLNVHNLGDRSRGYLKHLLRTYVSGQVSYSEETGAALPMRFFMVAYSLAATIYRASIILGLLYLVTRCLRPFHLDTLGQLLAAVVVGTMVVSPIRRTWQQWNNSRKLTFRERSRASWRYVVIAALLGTLFLTPLPYRVVGEAVVASADQETVYVTSPGFLDRVHVSIGEGVSEGTLLAELANPELEQEHVQAELTRDQLEVTYENLKRTLQTDAASQIPAAHAAWKEAERHCQSIRRKLDALRIVAPRSGTVMSPQPRTIEKPRWDLPSWLGHPLDRPNAGSWLDVGTPLCIVGDPQQPVVQVLIDQHQLEAVKRGQTGIVWLEGQHGQLHQGKITEIAMKDSDEILAPLSVRQQGRVATIEGPTEFSSSDDVGSHERPLVASFYASLTLQDSSTRSILPGVRGQVRILSGKMSLAARAVRRIASALRLR